MSVAPRLTLMRIGLCVVIVLAVVVILCTDILRGSKGSVKGEPVIVAVDESPSLDAAVDPKVKLSRLIREYGDLKYREGASDGLGDRDSSRLRRAAADKTLAKITEAIK